VDAINIDVDFAGIERLLDAVRVGKKYGINF
jgi:hypothetical protein